jgi:hypothetical protein
VSGDTAPLDNAPESAKQAVAMLSRMRFLAYFESGGMSRVTALMVSWVAAVASLGRKAFRRPPRNKPEASAPGETEPELGGTEEVGDETAPG